MTVVHLLSVAASTAVSAIIAGLIGLGFAWLKLSPMWQEHRDNQRQIIAQQTAILQARAREERPPAQDLHR